jgi:hypothetical protein
MRSNSNLIVSALRRTTIAGHLAAMRVDVDVRPSAHVLLAGTDVGVPQTKRVFATLNTTLAKMLASLRLPAKLPPLRP